MPVSEEKVTLAVKVTTSGGGVNERQALASRTLGEFLAGLKGKAYSTATTNTPSGATVFCDVEIIRITRRRLK